jgi:hypothetical protein
MKRTLMMIGAALLAAVPISMAAASPAMAGQTSGPIYIAYYHQYLTDPYDGGNGSDVRFFGSKDSKGATWDTNFINNVASLNPFKSSGLNSQYGSDNVFEIENNFDHEAYSLGTDEDRAVMRPTSAGNWFVDVPEGSGTFKLISVYATNNFGGGEIPYCLTFFATGQQAQYVSCNSSGQILNTF